MDTSCDITPMESKVHGNLMGVLGQTPDREIWQLDGDLSQSPEVREVLGLYGNV